MATFASGSGFGVTYVKEAQFGVTPPSPEMRRLRITSSSIEVSKDGFQSNELRPDRQISDFRQGTYKVGGDVGIEFSFAEFDDILAAAVGGKWQENPDAPGQQVLVAGIEETSFTIEQEYTKLNGEKFERFTGMKVGTLSISVPVNNMVTGKIGFTGADATVEAAPLDTDPTASFSFSPYDGLTGKLLEGGIPNAVVTSVEISINNGLDPKFILYQKGAAGITEGRINITGTVSAIFDSMEMLKKFLEEKASSLALTFGDGITSSYTLTLPRIKYTGGSKPVDGEGTIALSMPFQAILDPCTGTNIRIDRIPGPQAAPCVITYVADELHESAATPDTIETVITAEVSGGEDGGKFFAGTVGQQIPGARWTDVPVGLVGSVIKRSDTEAEITLTGTADATLTPGTVTLEFPAKSFVDGYCKCTNDAITGKSKTFTIVPA